MWSPKAGHFAQLYYGRSEHYEREQDRQIWLNSAGINLAPYLKLVLGWRDGSESEVEEPV